MTREEFLKTRNEIFQNIGEIKSGVKKGGATAKQTEELDVLYKTKIKLYADYILDNKPCNVGDTFSTESAGGRKIKGIVDDFFIVNGNVYIESYYPIINGNKKTQLAFFSIPHKELKIL